MSISTFETEQLLGKRYQVENRIISLLVTIDCLQETTERLIRSLNDYSSHFCNLIWSDRSRYRYNPKSKLDLNNTKWKKTFLQFHQYQSCAVFDTQLLDMTRGEIGHFLKKRKSDLKRKIGFEEKTTYDRLGRFSGSMINWWFTIISIWF